MPSSHGGKRDGAGRKGAGPGRVRISATISPELAAMLHAYHREHGGSFSMAVEYFLRHGCQQG